jgi:hypothetical protein
MLDTPMGEVPREIVYTRHDGPRGLEWLRQSYALFRRARLQWVVLVLCYYLVLLAIKLVPFAGGLAAVIMKPVFAVGFLAAAWNQERGVQPSPRHLFQGFRSNLWALLPLGVLIIANIAIAVGATSLIDGGRLLDLLTNPAPDGMDTDAASKRLSDTFGDPRVEIGMLFGMLCAVPLMLALWWAPALVVFQDASVRTALRTSLRASLANWRPMLVWCSIVFFFSTVVPSVVGQLLWLVLPSSISPVIIAGLFVVYLWSVVAVMQISDYVSYRDVFHAGETLAPIERAARTTR